jgi:hypothetical protein
MWDDDTSGVRCKVKSAGAGTVHRVIEEEDGAIKGLG